jgi:PHP family Zn ribbon phosphoesterase
MRTCTNCGSTITCGCQDRIASDGKKVCGNCLASYEDKMKLEALIAQSNNTQNENPPS